jgi:hypothetical protein
MPLPDVFPFQGMKGDGTSISKRILTDGQDEPVTRIKRDARKLFDLNFAARRQEERDRAKAFWDEFHPDKRFIYRDYENCPPVDCVCRFPENSEFEFRGGLIPNDHTYSFQVFESIYAPATSIPLAPVIPVEAPDEPDSGGTPAMVGELLFGGEQILFGGEPITFGL